MRIVSNLPGLKSLWVHAAHSQFMTLFRDGCVFYKDQDHKVGISSKSQHAQGPEPACTRSSEDDWAPAVLREVPGSHSTWKWLASSPLNTMAVLWHSVTQGVL